MYLRRLLPARGVGILKEKGRAHASFEELPTQQPIKSQNAYRYQWRLRCKHYGAYSCPHLCCANLCCRANRVHVNAYQFVGKA